MKKVLVIEDEKDIRTNIVDLLNGAGYQSISAHNGLEAINILEREIPDLVISDIMMPDVDGYQVLEHFQKIPATSTVPFIFLTAKADNSDIREGMKSGADDYLTKPFRAKELLESVEAQLKKKERADNKFDEIFLGISAYVPHELRTPLIPILGYTEIIREGLEDLSKDEISEMLNKIKISGRKLHKTIEKFIRYSDTKLRLTKNNTNSYNNYLSPAETIIKIAAKKMVIEQNRQSDLIMDVEDADLLIWENDLEFIVEELMENAIKFSNQGTQIIVKGKIANDMYELKITDLGRGISKEQLTNINPFGQHERKKYQQAGIGLGLISIKNLMDFYGGKIELNSIVNEFTTCCISLPVSNKIVK